MGQSGFDIMDSDEAMDVHYLYFEKYNSGKSPEEINKWFEENNKFNFQNKVIEDCSNFWLGLAWAQWQVKALSPFVLDRVKEIVQTDIEKEDWEGDYPQRKKALEAFLKKIQKETKTAKKPVKQRLFKAPFEKGDVITYRIHSGEEEQGFTSKWGLSVCIENSIGLQKTASCLFAETTFEKDQPAVLEDIHSAFVDHDWYGATIFGAAICDAEQLEQTDHIVKLGKIEVQRSFAMRDYLHASWYFYFTDTKKELRIEKPELFNSLRLRDVIHIPDHPYSAWAEKIVRLTSLPYTEEAANAEKFKEVADFMLAVRQEDENKFLNEFIPFVKNYMVRDWDARSGQSPLRMIGWKAGHQGALFDYTEQT